MLTESVALNSTPELASTVGIRDVVVLDYGEVHTELEEDLPEWVVTSSTDNLAVIKLTLGSIPTKKSILKIHKFISHIDDGELQLYLPDGVDATSNTIVYIFHTTNTFSHYNELIS